MTKELIYKAKTTPKEEGREFNNIWVYGDLIKSGEKFYIHSRSNLVRVSGELGKLIVMHEVIPETICLGAELPKGSMIWEDDIVLTIIDHQAYIGVIKFGMYDGGIRIGKCLGFYIDWQEETGWPDGDIMFWANKVKVIGNVHDNPELLKEGE